MIFSIRDDDISYFTTPELLKKTYRDIWDDVPISFAVVPFISGANFIPQGFDRKKRYSIGYNKTLVKFLKRKIKQGKASIMLHGFTHRWDDRGHEFQIDSDLFEKVKEGKEYLEDTFETKINSFVAPNHAFSKIGMRAVVDNKLNIVGAPGLKDRPIFWRFTYAKNLARLAIFRYSHRDGIRYPYLLDFKNHKEIYCYGIAKYKPRELFSGLEYCNKKNGVFCIGIHSHSIKGKISIIRELVEKTKSMNVRYSTIDSVFNL